MMIVVDIPVVRGDLSYSPRLALLNHFEETDPIAKDKEKYKNICHVAAEDMFDMLTAYTPSVYFEKLKELFAKSDL